MPEGGFFTPALPVMFRPDRFEALARREVTSILQSLPGDVRRAAEQCEIVYETGIAEGDDAGLLGLFTGCSLMDGMPEGAEDLPRITLFLAEIRDMTGGETAAFREEVRITFLHELGHYLGWGEEEVEERGLA